MRRTPRSCGWLLILLTAGVVGLAQADAQTWGTPRQAEIWYGGKRVTPAEPTEPVAVPASPGPAAATVGPASEWRAVGSGTSQASPWPAPAVDDVANPLRDESVGSADPWPRAERVIDPFSRASDSATVEKPTPTLPTATRRDADSAPMAAPVSPAPPSPQWLVPPRSTQDPHGSIPTAPDAEASGGITIPPESADALMPQAEPAEASTPAEQGPLGMGSSVSFYLMILQLLGLAITLAAIVIVLARYGKHLPRVLQIELVNTREVGEQLGLRLVGGPLSFTAVPASGDAAGADAGPEAPTILGGKTFAVPQAGFGPTFADRKAEEELRRHERDGQMLQVLFEENLRLHDAIGQEDVA